MVGEGAEDGFVGKAVNRRFFDGDDKFGLPSQGVANLLNFLLKRVRFGFDGNAHSFIINGSEAEWKLAYSSAERTVYMSEAIITKTARSAEWLNAEN